MDQDTRQEAFRADTFESQEPCWKCGGRLLRIEPDYHGWNHYCPRCRHATCPEAELRRQVAELGPGAVGVVAAVPVSFSLIPTVGRRTAADAG